MKIPAFLKDLAFGISILDVANSMLHGKNKCMEQNAAENLGTYAFSFIIPESAIDANGHVNNVAYVQWMQDLAIQHWRKIGGMSVDQKLNCTWVARSHHIEYLSPAFEGEKIEAVTWIHNVRKVRSIRKYAFTRLTDNKMLARGETDWVFVDVASGRPRPVPDYVGEYLANQNP